MANTSNRTLRLLSLLQTHRYWPGTELAGRLGVSPRTLRRDVDRLRELGYPIEAQRGVDGGYQLAAGAVLPPLVIDDEEAVALVVGLQTAAQGAVEGLAEASVRMLAKVAQVMPARLRRRAGALREMTVPADWGFGPPRASVDPAVLTAVALACRDSEQLRFAYTAADGRRTDRLVEPHRLVCPGRRWYLVAYDLARHDWRSFRADRLTAPAPTGTRFRPRELPAADAAAFVRAGLDGLPRAYEVTALVDAPAAAVRARIGRWCTVEELPAEAGARAATDAGAAADSETDAAAGAGAAAGAATSADAGAVTGTATDAGTGAGTGAGAKTEEGVGAGAARCRIRMTAHSLDWPAVALASLDADFRVLEPPELLDRLRTLAERFTRALPTLRDLPAARDRERPGAAGTSATANPQEQRQQPQHHEKQQHGEQRHPGQRREQNRSPNSRPKE